MILALMMMVMTSVVPETNTEMCMTEPVYESNKCFFRCGDCERRCGDDSNCKANCHDMNATCCEANGEEGWLNMCGCH